MSLRRTFAILRKEIWHITRDARVLFLVTLAPAFLLLMLSYVFSWDVTHTRVAVVDFDHSAVSRDYLSRISADGDLIIVAQVEKVGDAEALLMRGDVSIVLVIPHGFGESVRAGHRVQVQALVDGMNAITARQSMAQLSARTRVFSALTSSGEALIEMAQRQPSPETLGRAWYNPALKSLYSMVPGLLAVVLFMPGMAATLALAREKETGSFEGLIATPVKGIEYLTGKLLAYGLMGLIGTVVALLLAVFWFGVPFRGSVALLLGLTAIYFFATMSTGILIANFVMGQQTAMIVFLLAFFMPSFFVAGLILPIDATSTISLLTSSAIPPTHFITISRAIFLKGLGLESLWESVLALLVIGGAMFTVSLLMFKKKIG
jgi:ABC-2 type transport system permease protein